MTQRQCEGCRWFHRSGSQLIGECRRYPPQHAHTQHGWLMVEQSESCGEWQDKNITPEQAERRELVRQFAVAIVAGDFGYESGGIGSEKVWECARQIAEAEGQT